MTNERANDQDTNRLLSPRWVGVVIAAVGAVGAIATRNLMNLKLDCETDPPDVCGAPMADAIEHPWVWVFILIFAFGLYRMVKPAKL